MIGTKKLSAIRQEIQDALSTGGMDPIQNLERQIACAKRKGDPTVVMEGLKRFLESTPKQTRRQPGAGKKSAKR